MTDTSPNAPAARVAQVARSLAVARREAALAAIMTGLTEPFMTPFALALGASRFQVGLLSSARHFEDEPAGRPPNRSQNGLMTKPRHSPIIVQK